jgi:hypothetical protein
MSSSTKDQPRPGNDDRILTPEEVAEWLKVSVQWVQDHSNGHRGIQIPSLKFGGIAGSGSPKSRSGSPGSPVSARAACRPATVEHATVAGRSRASILPGRP